MLLIDGAHESGSGRQNIIDVDKDSLLWSESNALSNDIDKLSYREIGGNEVLLLVNSGNVALLHLLADDLQVRNNVSIRTSTFVSSHANTYRNTIRILLANTLSLSLSLL
jgi:hypothetical protein